MHFDDVMIDDCILKADLSVAVALFDGLQCAFERENKSSVMIHTAKTQNSQHSPTASFLPGDLLFFCKTKGLQW